MPNMAQIVSRHNNQLLKQLEPKTPEVARTCSCPKAVRDSASCPLGGQCLLTNTIYQATVTEVDSGQVQTYTGLASTDWKARLGVHKSSFKHKPKPNAKSSNGTELSKHTWELKDKNIEHTISWKISDRAQPFNPNSKMCRLCLTEKILMYLCTSKVVQPSTLGQSFIQPADIWPGSLFQMDEISPVFSFHFL